MYFSYGFERKREAEGQTLNRLASWAARHDDVDLFLIFIFGDRMEFERIAQTYGGQVAWVQDITWRSPWTTARDKYVGLIAFDCRNPAADSAGAFFSSEAALQGLAVIARAGCAEEIRPIIVDEHTQSVKGDDPRDFVEKLLDAGVLLVYALDLPDMEAILDEVVYVNDVVKSDRTDFIQSLGESSWTSTTGYERHIRSYDVAFLPEEKFEKPIEEFYRCWSRMCQPEPEYVFGCYRPSVRSDRDVAGNAGPYPQVVQTVSHPRTGGSHVGYPGWQCRGVSVRQDPVLSECAAPGYGQRDPGGGGYCGDQ